MSWRFGIPDFIGMYTYFKDLQLTGYNIPPAAARKETLFGMATSAVHNFSSALVMPHNIITANQFLEKVATNERNKELNVISTFCKQTGKQFPALQQILNDPNYITKNPDGFYAALTAALNEARRGTTDYLNELYKIKKNIDNTTRTLENYKQDDYKYRLDGEISSLLHRLSGNYNVIQEKDKNAYSLRIQTLAMQILNQFGLVNHISNGEDFSAIAASLLIQIEHDVQEEIDTALRLNSKETQDMIIDQALNNIEQKYLKIAHKQAAAITPIEKALNDISSIEFDRIVKNAKELLGITSDKLEGKELKLLRDRVRSRDKRAQKNSDLANIRNTIAKNSKLKRNLMLTKFTINGSQNSKHGTIYELVESILSLGVNMNHSGATDIMTYTINWNLQTDNAVLNDLLNNISASAASALTAQQNASSVEGIKDTTTYIRNLNSQIDRLIKETENKLKEMKDLNLDNIFIFHESLKLYSSAETGRNAHGGAFSGRKMNLLHYIDNLYSMTQMNFPINKNNMGFLALNLIGGAVGEDLKDPLEHYLSMYAGMIMFDDLANMSKEAYEQINFTSNQQGGHIIQIHLYNLNGMYVPASMILTYINDTVKQASNFAEEGVIAKATITTSDTGNSVYNSWANGKGWEDNKERIHNKNLSLTPAVWSAVAAASSAATKIEITFLAAFKRFISSL